ncbi:MAG: protein kinase [Candidatus Hydrogenedentes bacterium]|nr:protein kinase [Candidatus Hydrogenedentota bacterium]
MTDRIDTDSNHSEQSLKAGYNLGGRFALVRQLGLGAVGAVWLAKDTQLHDELVACKVLAPSFADDRRAIADLKREVLLTRRLRHPNIVAIHSFWDAHGDRFITMEYVPGANLAQRMKERMRAYELPEVIPWIEQICAALAYAHAQGVLHRDVKPANILLGPGGSVRLADFGIAQRIREAQGDKQDAVTSGTLMYMSPEQFRGKPIDERSDLYSLATTIYQMLNGTPPFYRGSIAQQIQDKAPLPISNCHEAINRVLLKALDKEPSNRHAGCREFLADFARVAHRCAGVALSSGMAAAIPSDFDADAPTVAIRRRTLARTAKPLGELLVEAGAITNGQLERALAKHRDAPGPLGAILIEMGLIDESELVQAVSEQMQIPVISLAKEQIDTEVARRVSSTMAQERRCIPLRYESGSVVLAMADPLDFDALNAIESACGAPAVPRIALESDILQTIDRVYAT